MAHACDAAQANSLALVVLALKEAPDILFANQIAVFLQPELCKDAPRCWIICWLSHKSKGRLAIVNHAGWCWFPGRCKFWRIRAQIIALNCRHQKKACLEASFVDVLVIYAGLFASAFLAATILPAQSELGLAALLSMGTLPTFWLITVASIGNILGAVVNWVLGQKFEQLKSKKWFPVTASQLERATKWFQRFGVWSLLFSWLPIIGDPITLAAGFFGVRFGLFLTLVAIAKTGRYLAIAILLFYF